MDINHRKIAVDILIILIVIIAFQPIKDVIFQIMNMSSNWAYLGPILYLIAVFIGGYIIGGRMRAIYKIFKTK